MTTKTSPKDHLFSAGYRLWAGAVDVVGTLCLEAVEAGTFYDGPTFAEMERADQEARNAFRTTANQRPNVGLTSGDRRLNLSVSRGKAMNNKRGRGWEDLLPP